MKIIPLLRYNNLKEAIAFYTNALGFNLKYPNASDDNWGVDLINNDAEILLASMDGTPRIAIYVIVDDVDATFK